MGDVLLATGGSCGIGAAMALAAEIAEPVLFLASDAAADVAGANLKVSGGR